MHYTTNDFIILLVNFIIDIKLVMVIKEDLKKKLRFMTTNESSQGQNSRTESILKKKKSVENKSNMMIILNFFTYLLCRVPELLGKIFFYFSDDPNFTLSGFKSCTLEIFCYLLSNTIEYLYMLSYSFNIFFYYHFISNFRTGFRRIFRFYQKKS